MKRIIFIALLFFSFQTYAGSNVAYLVCKSASGRTIFKAELQDIYFFSSCEFVIDGKKITITNEESGKVIFNAKNKVFTLAIFDKNEGWINFYAIPTTFKKIASGTYTQHYKFKAIVEGKDPRPENVKTPEIELDCELTYSI